MTIKYLGGFEINLNDNDSEYVKALLLTHGVDKKGFKFFEKVQSGFELHLVGNKLIQSYECSDGDKSLDAELVTLPIDSWEDHKVFFLDKSKNGIHRIGGEKPQNLIMPSHPQLKTPFQYIGTIDCSDKYFQWLPMSQFHIVYPMYECNFGIFLDYSNPDKPEVIEPVTFDPAWYEPGINDINVTFTEFRYSCTERFDPDKFDDDEQFLCGVPLWYQAPHVPISPAGNIMKYVCTIGSDYNIKVNNYESYNGHLRDDYLIFGDAGHLYVFFDPLTKIAHLQIQF
jgi:hypothetical protein